MTDKTEVVMSAQRLDELREAEIAVLRLQAREGAIVKALLPLEVQLVDLQHQLSRATAAFAAKRGEALREVGLDEKVDWVIDDRTGVVSSKER